MEYEEIKPISRIEAEAIFDSSNDYKISKALVRLAYYDEDWRWVQSKCLEYLENSGKEIQSTAVLCLGHLARIHHQLDLETVLPVLMELRNDSSLIGKIEDTLDDIRIYIDS